jgi:hypothetical protein
MEMNLKIHDPRAELDGANQWYLHYNEPFPGKFPNRFPIPDEPIISWNLGTGNSDRP